MKKLLLSLVLVAGSLALFAPSTAQAQDVGFRIGGHTSGLDIWIGGGNRYDHRHYDHRDYRWRNNRDCYPDYNRRGSWDNCSPRYEYRQPIQVYVAVGYRQVWDRWSRCWTTVTDYGYVWATWDARWHQYVYRDPISGRLVAVSDYDSGYRRW